MADFPCRFLPDVGVVTDIEIADDILFGDKTNNKGNKRIGYTAVGQRPTAAQSDQQWRST